MSGGSQPATTTTKIENPGQQEMYQIAMPFLRQFAANPPSLPSGGTVAGFDPAQVAGQEAILGAAGGPQTGLAQSGANAAQFLSHDVLSPSSNPALQATINAATLPIQQNLMESTLPALRGGAEAAGGFGGTRRQIAEGLASGRASQAIGATGAGIANQGYQAGLDAMVKNLGLLPGTMQSQLMPGLAQSGVGDVRQSMAQALLGERNLYEQYPQLLPLLMGQTIAGIGTGMQPTGSTTTATASGGNPLMQGLGLGISGLGALGSLGGAGGIASLLPFLSDRRLKRNVSKVGQINGVNVYRYRYRRSDAWQLGFMADDVPARHVLTVLGFKVVNYLGILRGA